MDSSTLGHQEVSELWLFSFINSYILCTWLVKLSLEFILQLDIEGKSKTLFMKQKTLEVPGMVNHLNVSTLSVKAVLGARPKKSQGLADADSSSGSKGALSSAEAS